jgi:hypothetical protein
MNLWFPEWSENFLPSCRTATFLRTLLQGVSLLHKVNVLYIGSIWGNLNLSCFQHLNVKLKCYEMVVPSVNIKMEMLLQLQQNLLVWHFEIFGSWWYSFCFYHQRVVRGLHNFLFTYIFGLFIFYCFFSLGYITVYFSSDIWFI